MKILVHMYDGTLQDTYLFNGENAYDNAVDAVSRILTHYGWTADFTNTLCQKLSKHTFVESGEHTFQIVEPSKLP